MRIAAGIEYDGSHFYGWQIQNGVRTVQEQVERALSRVANHRLGVVCAGRTDTGVHATQQVIHFQTQARRSERSWVLGANAHLPPEVCVTWAYPVDEGFHARFSALSRHYRYVILNRWVRPALLRGRVTWSHAVLDADRMQAAGRLFVGEQDFSSFRALACQAKSPVRRVYDVAVGREGAFLYIDVHANGFLHHMVRNMAGVMMSIGRGEHPVEWVTQLLQLRDRSHGGVTAPAEGLYLVGVDYPREFGLPGAPIRPRFG